MLASFLSFGKKQKLFQTNDRFLLAVSGGIDSVVMAHLFKEAGFSFGIAHCNFSLRGKESEEDEIFVRQLAGKLGCEYFVSSFDTEGTAVKLNISIQEAARKLRYDWFETICIEKGYELVCTAHHSDDSIETFFINLLRGTGLAGLTGVPVKNGRVIRPLLFAGKEAIQSYATGKQLTHREDSSNLTDDYLRNRIRHNLVPLMEDLSPSFRTVLQSDMQKLQDSRHVLDAFVRTQKNNLIVSDGLNFYILLKNLEKKEPLRFWLYACLQEFGFREATIGSLTELLGKKNYSGRIFDAPDYELCVERDRLWIRRKSLQFPVDETLLISSEATLFTDPFAFRTELVRVNHPFDPPVGPSVACMDRAKLVFPLLLRRWKDGDRFRPLGMKGSKLLSDFFSDNKFTAAQKEQTWVVESDGDIAWIVGHRLDDRFKLGPTTEEAFLLLLS
jgi:tRNA(Ile)-lysidine synthase